MKAARRTTLRAAILLATLAWAARRGPLPAMGLETLPAYALAALALSLSLGLLSRRIRRGRILMARPSRIDRMSGEEFELWLKAWFERRGYRVRTTDRSGDYGADLVLTGRGGRTVVQAKRYGGRVGVEAVQQVVASMPHYGAKRCIVATNSHFTRAAETLARENGVTLLDREALLGGRA